MKATTIQLMKNEAAVIWINQFRAIVPPAMKCQSFKSGNIKVQIILETHH